MKKVNLTTKAKIYLIISTIFIILTFIGAFYVISNNGEVSAGYAVVPMLFVIIFSGLVNQERNEINKKK